MSDGDEEPAEETDASGDEELPELSFDERLDAAEAELEAAETESDLDDVEADLDAIEGDLEDADLPEPEDEDDEDPREELEGRLSDLRSQLDEQRGPYAEDVVTEIEGAKSEITDTRWTESGETELVATVESFADQISETLDADVTADGEDTDALAATLDDAADAVEAADLDADEDAETIAELLEAAEELAAGVEDAEAWDDLSVRDKLRAEGYYDVLGQKHKDFPPEWSALKEWETRDNAEMILLALDHLGDSGFFERHCLEALERMGNPAAFDEMESRAGKRDKDAIAVLGKIGDAAALDTILEYVEADSDPQLQRVTMRAVGEIGSEEATQMVANQLVSETESVRSRAARTLGLIGDTRAVEPLAVMLDEDDSQEVRASAAWALVQIGTQSALETAAEYAEDPSFLVESEAEAAERALGAAPSA